MSVVAQLEPGHRPPRRRHPTASPGPLRAEPAAASPSRPAQHSSGPRLAALGDPGPGHAVPGPDGDRDRLSRIAWPAVPHAVTGQLRKKRGVIRARMPGTGHRARERAGGPRPLSPPAVTLSRIASPITCHPPSRPPGSRNGRTHSGMHARFRADVKPPDNAASAARPWPSVEKPTVRTDRPEARTPSAIRPWTPRHAAPQRYTMTHHGTKKKRPA
jgi:hypothetical protein